MSQANHVPTTSPVSFATDDIVYRDCMAARPIAACSGAAFVPVVYHPNRVAEYLRQERLPRKAKATGDEALAYAARVIWYRQMRANEKRRKREATVHPRYFRYFSEAAE
jgi:hypothetical protein